jgi:threonine synthase
VSLNHHTAADLDTLRLTCHACSRSYPVTDLAWRCAGCGGLLDLTGFTATVPSLAALAGRRPSLWRYAEALPLPEPLDITLGEGMTPVVTAPGRPAVALKLDYLMPSGSFKDRGAVMLAALAAHLAPKRLLVDSSGNAGTAVAAYAARAGIPCDVYVPSSAR